MNCGVKTGTLYIPDMPSPAPDCVVPSPGKVILFSPETNPGVVYSKTFTVTEGNSALLDAYNVQEGKHIYVNRVVRSSYCPPVGDACDPLALSEAKGRDGVIVFRERMTLGSDPSRWHIYRDADPDKSILQLFIAVPGTYELELEETEMLGDLEVELQFLKNEALPRFPSDYFAGVKND